MKPTLNLIYTLACVLCLGGLIACSSIHGVGVNGGYNPDTGEITAGVAITFATGPDAETLTALQASGAYGGGQNWGFIAVTNQVQRDAVTLALQKGANLTAPAKK